MLSRRELEVADLVTRGMTNREIAQKLFRSERTVEGHVQQILNKLGFDSRAQIAAWAVEQRTISAETTPVTVGGSITGTARSSRRPWGLLAAMLALVVVVGSALASALKSQLEPHPGPDRVTVIATGITGSNGGFMAIDSQQAVYITTGVTPEGVHRIGLDGSVTAVSPNIAASSIVIGPNDVLYVSGNDPRVTVGFGIWRLQDGVWMRVAGKDDGGSSEDGAQALDARVWPLGLALDDSGDIYYSDQYGFRYVIRKITPDGRVFTVAGSGQPGYSGDDGPATLARLRQPLGLVVTKNGDLYFADSLNHRVRRVRDGTITTVAGNGRAGYSGDGGPAVDAMLNDPFSIAFDTHGNLFVSDSANNRIRKITPSGRISTVVGTGHRGAAIEGKSPSQAELWDPTGIAIDSHGNLYIDDTLNDRVLKVRLG